MENQQISIKNIIIHGLEESLFYLHFYSFDHFSSDDEFEPINVENGKETNDENNGSVNGVQPPLYLRDCISGKTYM